MSHGAVMQPRARSGRPGDSGSGCSCSGDSGRRPPPFSASCSPGGARGGRAPPHLRAGGTTALGALLRCFPCERLCGGCAVPPVPPRLPGALPPAAPPPRRRLPPPHVPQLPAALPPHLQLRALPGAPGPARRAHLQVLPGQPWPCLPVQLGEQAFESSQKYKEGKFIIEMSHMVKENGWD
ncbi:hypothetical protein Q9966_013452 [Columba livia]|nr:hypothetical protein Q9966_013452 [Columba livia]